MQGDWPVGLGLKGTKLETEVEVQASGPVEERRLCRSGAQAEEELMVFSEVK